MENHNQLPQNHIQHGQHSDDLSNLYRMNTVLVSILTQLVQSLLEDHSQSLGRR